MNGCAFIELTFTLKDNNPIYIDNSGMASETGSNSSEFLFKIEKSNHQILLTGRKGTAWKNLSFTPINSLHLINEYGVSLETPNVN